MKNDPEEDLVDVTCVFRTFEEQRGTDPDLLSDVTAPLLPRRPTLPDSAIALPEPNDDEA